MSIFEFTCLLLASFGWVVATLLETEDKQETLYKYDLLIYSSGFT